MNWSRSLDMHLDSPELAVCIYFDTDLKVAHEVVANLFTDNAIFPGTVMNSVFSKELAESKLFTINRKLLHWMHSIPDVIRKCLWFVAANRERFQRLAHGPVGKCGDLLVIHIGFYVKCMH